MTSEQDVQTQSGQTTANGSTEQNSQETSTTELQDSFPRDYVEKLRSEAKGYRTELSDVKAKLTAFEEAQMSELEKAKAQADAFKAQVEAANAQVQQARAEAAISTAAGKAGLPVDLALRLVDVQFDDEGKPMGIDEAVQGLVQQYPQLVSGGGTSAMNGANGKKRPLTREEISKMSPQEINERWSEISQAMKK